MALTDRSLVLIGVAAAAVLVVDAIVFFALIDDWGDLGGVVANVLGIGAILTLVVVGVVLLTRRSRR